MCGPHWSQLKKAIEARGLGSLIASSSEELHRRMHSENKSDRFEPLLAAMFGLAQNAIAVVGPEVLCLASPDGTPKCAICYLIENCGCEKEPCEFLAWIDCAADSALDLAREAGLAAPAELHS